MNPLFVNETVVIDDAAVLAGVPHKQKPAILSPFFWHKIVVKNAEGESRDLVLQALMDAVRPHDFIPVSYEATGYGMVSFLVKNCGQAILQFCELNLTVSHPETTKKLPPFRLKIILKEKHSSDFKVDIQQNIVGILKRRYFPAKKSLDLEQFHLDRDLTEFCPLSQPKLLYFVLHLARDLDLAQLKLANNDIEVLKPFEVFFGDRNAKNLISIDLRKNKVKSMEEVSIMKMFPLIELTLEDNPICNEYKEHEYIKILSTYFPQLSKLDGCRINRNGMVPLRRNFVCSYSAVELIDRFMEHYFNLYDSSDRAVLENLYHKDSVFTITSHFLAGQTSSSKAKLVEFQKFSHNIKLISDYSKINESVYTGPRDIIKILTSLPSTEHDPFTFTVDLMYFQERVVILTVTGVFKHAGENLLENDYLYNFMRTFVLREVCDGEYKIINEVMNVTNATSLAQLRSFKVTRVPPPTHVNVSLPKNEAERNEAIETFMILTNMKREWSRKCMKENDFDMKKSLSMFIDLFKGDKLPMHAFNNFETFERSQIQKKPTAGNPQPTVNPNLQTVGTTSELPTTNKTKVEPPEITVEDDDLLEEEIDEDIKDRDMLLADESFSRRKQEYLKVLLSECDKSVIDALTMPKNTTNEEALVLLTAATKSVATLYKDNLWYYKLLGMTYYRLGFLEQGRGLLDMARTSLTNDEFSILKDTFLIFEIHYGHESVVDKLVREKIDNEPLTPTLNLITKDALRAGVHLVRSLLTRMTSFNISEEKLLQIMIAFHDYETVVGGNANIAAYKELAKKLFPKYKLDSENVYYKTIPQSVRTTTEAELKETTDMCDEFRRFRNALLEPVGIFNDDIDDQRVRRLVRFSGPDAALLKICNDLVTKHKGRLAMLKIACVKLWERDLHDEITKLFEKAKKFCNEQLLDNLILLYKIKTDLLVGKENEIMDKLKLHVNVIPTTQLLNFLEDLANENNPYISKIFESFLNDPLMNFEKKRLIALEYKVFALKMRDPGLIKRADDFVRKWFVAFEAFHYGETLRSLENMPIPFEYARKFAPPILAGLVERYLEEYSHAFMVGLHAIWIYFLMNLRRMARETRRKCLLKLEENDDLRLKFSIISSMLEAKYGDHKRAEKDLMALEKDYGMNMNYICALAECSVMKNNFDGVRVVLQKHILDVNVIMDPEVQKVMFIYFHQWKKITKMNVLRKILTNEFEAAPKVTD